MRFVAQRRDPILGPLGQGKAGLLETLCRGHTLFYNVPFMCNLAGQAIVRSPLVRCQSEEAVGHVLVVVFGGICSVHTLGDRYTICLPGHCCTARVEVVNHTHHCGLVCLELLR